MKGNININNLFNIISLLIAINKSKVVADTSDFTTLKDNLGNINVGNGMVNNHDCLTLTLSLNDMNLDYGWKNNNQCCMYKRVTCTDSNGKTTAVTTNNTKITELFFNDMQINEPASLNLCQLTSLKILQFVNNSGMNGNIPACLGNIEDLEIAIFANTPVTGMIPNSIINLKKLKYLSFENTNIQGSLPSNMSNMKNLKDLYINNNPNISGSLPSDLAQLTNLEKLSVADTKISGTLPEKIGSLKNLKMLSLHDTNIEGTIPESIGNLKNLESLLLYNTKLSGSLPASIKQLNNLNTFRIENTSIGGSLPDGFNPLTLKDCSLANTNVCLGNENILKNQNVPACISSLSLCSAGNVNNNQTYMATNPTNSNITQGQPNENDKKGKLSFGIYGLFFLGILAIVAISFFIYRKCKQNKSYEQEKRAINMYKNNVNNNSNQPRWIQTTPFSTASFEQKEGNISYKVQQQQHEDSIESNKGNNNPSLFKKIYTGLLKSHNYQKLNENQFENLDSNNMYLIPSDSVFQYNTMGIDENQNMNNEEVQVRNNDEETYVNNGGERIRYKNEPGMEMIEVSSNKSLRHKSLDSEKTEYENINNKLYDAMNKNYTNSIGSAIPLPPNTENMVFMGKEAQEELKIFQQQQQQQHINNYNQKEQLVELGLMSTNDHPYHNKSSKGSKGTTYVNYDYSNNKSTDRQFNPMDYNKSNDKYDEYQSSFNGLDLNSENFHNSKTFDKIEKKFINNLNTLRTTSPNDSVANKTREESEMNESNFFANIPGLQIQQYYNQLNLSMEDSNTTDNDWTNNQSKINSPTNDNENQLNKIIPSGIFTTNKTSWDTDEESFSSNDSSFRDTKNSKINARPTGTINTAQLPKSKLGTEYMVIDDDSYSIEQIKGNSRNGRENQKSIDNDDDDGYSHYKSGGTETEDYSHYKSGGTTTDNDYSKYQSGFIEDSKYKSVASTEDDLSKYQSGVTIEEPKFRGGLTIDIPKYSSGITIENQEDRYRSGVTLDSNGNALSNNMNFAMSPIMKTGHDSTTLISPINGPSISLISPIMKNGPNSSLFSPVIKNSGNKSSLMLPAKNADRMLKTSSNLRVMSNVTEELFSDMSKLSGFAEVPTDNELSF